MDNVFIICAAIRLLDGRIFYGHRHNHAIQAMNDELSWDMSRKQLKEVVYEQGFIASTGYFVTREHALTLARNANQLNKEPIRNNQLYSENLY